jgi:hypothetical protein
MIDEFYRRSIEMLREEKGVWNKVLQVLLQFREEATGRTFRYLRAKESNAKTILGTIYSLLEEKLDRLIDLLKRQLRLVAEKEGKFLKEVFQLPLSRHPRKLDRVRGEPLVSGWLRSIFGKVKKRIRKTLQYSLSQGHPAEDLLDKVFGRDLPKMIRVGKWSGSDFQGGALSEAKRTLQSLITTAYYEMTSKVRNFAYKRASQVEVLKSIAILDGKTTSTCHQHDGLLFTRGFKPIGHNTKFIDVPRHWNCRSQILPETVSGKKLKQVSFETWFRKLSRSAQNSLLTPKGGALYRTEGVGLLSIIKRLPPVYLG